MLNFYNDEQLMIDFSRSIGCRIMEAFHENYESQENLYNIINPIYEACLKVISDNGFHIGYQHKRECIMWACEDYSFVVPEASEEEISAYENFTNDFLKQKVLADIKSADESDYKTIKEPN